VGLLQAKGHAREDVKRPAMIKNRWRKGSPMHQRGGAKGGEKKKKKGEKGSTNEIGGQGGGDRRPQGG